MMKVQFITHHNDRLNEVEGARLALQGGCRWIQLRMKEADDDEVIRAGLQLRQLCTEYGATLILDDRVHLVHEVRADGVHLGQQDMPIDKAREHLGADVIIGGTANTMDDIRRLWHWGADYIGCGPLRYTTTKKRLAPLLGHEGYRKLLSQMHKENITLPLVAIGGITPEDILPLQHTGVNSIAISGYILNADDPKKAMENLINHGE